MITIVYSTKKHNWNVGNYLQKSCGVNNAEIIEIENPGIMSLTQAYQNGLVKAKYDTVIFVHDDVTFQTPNWGKKIIKIFQNTDYGVIGLAGTTDLGTDGKWWEDRLRMVGIVKHTNGKKTWENRYSGAFPKEILPTVNVDGLFIAVNRNRIKYEFDTTIPGFHFYDIDFSFGNFVRGVKVGVTTDIRVIHRGLGETDQQWEVNRLSFVEKFKDHLPATIIPEPIIANVESLKFNNLNKKLVIVIHGKDPQKIKKCIEQIKTISKYKNYRIVVAYSDYDDYNDQGLIIDDENVLIVETGIDNFSENSNKIITEHLNDDDEIVLFMGENSLIQNDVISMGVYYLSNTKNCGTVSASIYNENKTIFNCGYEIWNITQPPIKENEEPQSSLLVNLIGNGSYFSYRNEFVGDSIGGTKDFLMVDAKLIKKFQFNVGYKKAFQDLELNLRLINDRKSNIVLGDGVVCLQENVIPENEYYEDLNNVFLPFIYGMGLDVVDKYLKHYTIPTKQQ